MVYRKLTGGEGRRTLGDRIRVQSVKGVQVSYSARYVVKAEVGRGVNHVLPTFLSVKYRRERYYMAETKRLITINRTVYSTEEFSALKQAADRAGARIIRTTSLRDGAGINVELEMDGSRQQF